MESVYAMKVKTYACWPVSALAVSMSALLFPQTKKRLFLEESVPVADNNGLCSRNNLNDSTKNTPWASCRHTSGWDCACGWTRRNIRKIICRNNPRPYATAHHIAMVGTRVTKDDGNGEGYDHETNREISDPTSKLEKRLIRTQNELDSWMLDARHLLLEYLEFCRQKAQAHSVADEIKQCNQVLDNEWPTNWASKTDVQTGEIYDQATQADMIQAMETEEEKRSQCHRQNRTTEWHTRYQEAQSYWEDFLYYQNQWNRRIRAHHSQGTAWADFLVRLYNGFEIGARDNIPEAIGADQLHRYPDGVRSHSSRPTFVRRQLLRQKFPRSAVRLDHESIEHHRNQVDNQRRTDEGFDARCLPDSENLLQPYYAATAREWRDRGGNEPQTSWETQDLGHAVASLNHISPDGPVDNRPRYQMKQVQSLMRTFVWEGKGKGNKTGEEVSGEHKQFLGHYIDTVRHESHFVLDRDGHRIEENKGLHPIKLPGPTKYEVPSSPNMWNRVQGPGRRDRARLRVSDGTSKDWRKDRAAPDDTRDAEFSDDEHTDEAAIEDELDTDLEEFEGESDNERDLFTLSYQGVPLPEIISNYRPGNNTPAPDDDICDGETDTDSDQNSDNDEHNDSRECAGPKMSGEAKGNTTSVSKPTSKVNGERVSQHEPNPKAVGETFEAVPGNDDRDLATYTHTFPDGTTFTQRTLVPAFRADVEPAAGRNPPRKVYPANGSIPAVKRKSTSWKSNPKYAPRADNKFEAVNGRWDNGDYHWVPTVIIRSFRLDNNGYYACSINPHFGAIMKGDEVSNEVLQKKYIAGFNKGFKQVYRRSDRDVRSQLDVQQFGAWTIGELNVARNFARSIIQRDGLAKWFEDWKERHVKILCARINAHRAVNGQNHQGKKPRSQDSVTSKFKRYFADLLERAERLKEDMATGKQPSEHELKPKDVLTGDATIVKRSKPAPKQSETKSDKAKVASLSKVNTLQSSNKATKRPRAASGSGAQLQVDGVEQPEAGDDLGFAGTKAPKAKRSRKG
jgi:hypothetical protein